MMYRPNAPHGVDTSAVPQPRYRENVKPIEPLSSPVLKNGIQKLHLINEALARARMRELWRPEHRHKRKAGDIIRDVRRQRARR